MDPVCTPISPCAHLSAVCAHFYQPCVRTYPSCAHTYESRVCTPIVCANLPRVRTTLHFRERLWILTTPTCVLAASPQDADGSRVTLPHFLPAHLGEIKFRLVLTTQGAFGSTFTNSFSQRETQNINTQLSAPTTAVTAAWGGLPCPHALRSEYRTRGQNRTRKLKDSKAINEQNGERGTLANDIG